LGGIFGNFPAPRCVYNEYIMTDEYRRNHYVPEWYQKNFFSSEYTSGMFFYLNLYPDSFIDTLGRPHTHTQLRHFGPPSCFMEDDLYTTKFGNWESKDIEKKFFGEIDSTGKKAIGYFQNFNHPSANHEAFEAMIRYLSVQKLRTPKGLQQLSRSLNNKDRNLALIAMQKLQQVYCAIWTEAVWTIADASQSTVKFILSDHPVTVYNMGSKFSTAKRREDEAEPEIWQSGTHTLFPLNLDKLLILTNQSWVRNPYGDPLKLRPNPNPLRDAIFNFTEIQTGRILSEIEVMKINYIIKKRAHRYIAAVEKEWLFPEKNVTIQNWRNLGKEHLLMPDPRVVRFTTSIAIQYSNGSSAFFDGYGRRPWESGFQSEKAGTDEWKTFHRFQKEYEKKFGPKLRGITFDQVSSLKRKEKE
jgi:hypothetical protein